MNASKYDVVTVSASQTIARDPGAFLQQIDWLRRQALFVRVDQASIRAASFLDDRLGLQQRDAFWMPLERLSDIAAECQESSFPQRYIFHIGHCGSTLLSRLLDQGKGALGIREPVVLRDLALLERDLDSPMARFEREHWQRLFVDCLAIVGRQFEFGQQVTIKATSTCNNLLRPLLDLKRHVRIVLMFMPLESYLATMLKAPGGGLDALQAAPARLAFLHDVMGDSSLRLHQLDLAETLAMGWASEVLRFLQIEADDFGYPAVMLLDFDRFLAEPFRMLEGVCEHLQIPGDFPNEAALMQSAVISGYSKSPAHPYSPEDRAYDLDLSRRKFSAEINRGMQWVESMLRRIPGGQRLASFMR